MAVIDEKNRIVTARESANLLTIHSEISSGILVLKAPNSKDLRITLPLDEPGQEATLFGLRVPGLVLNSEASGWISEVLRGNYRLLYRGSAQNKGSDAENNAKVKGMGYPDSGAVHLINQKTLDALNSSLQNKVQIENFRPNLVVEGAEAFEEDHWSEISINRCRLQTRDRTVRCVVTTIDPKTAVRNNEVEPLATLGKVRRAEGLPVTFGIDMEVLSGGYIRIGDEVVVT